MPQFEWLDADSSWMFTEGWDGRRGLSLSYLRLCYLPADNS